MTWAWGSCGWAEAVGDITIPGFRDHVLDRLVVPGPLNEAVRDRAELEQAHCLPSWAALGKTRAMDFCLRLRPTSTWADGGVIAKAIEDLAAQEALCVLVEKWDAEAVLREVGVPVKEK